MDLKELRKEKGLTQRQCADLLGVSLRTYINYETDDAKQHNDRYAYMIERLERYGAIDETHGLLTVEKIKSACEGVFEHYAIDYCYLFGSYAKGRATETSDVDLLIACNLTGLKFYGLIESLRETLKKKVDVLGREQLTSNPSLANEILKDGIKLYG